MVITPDSEAHADWNRMGGKGGALVKNVGEQSVCCTILRTELGVLDNPSTSEFMTSVRAESKFVKDVILGWTQTCRLHSSHFSIALERLFKTNRPCSRHPAFTRSELFCVS